MSDTEQESKLFIIAASVAMFTGLLAPYTVPVVIGSVMDGLRFNPAMAGFLGMAELAGLAFTTLLLSKFVTGWPWRRVALAGALFAATMQLLSAFTVGLGLLTGLRMATGVGCGFVLAIANTIIARSHDPEVMYGRVSALYSVGFACLLFALPIATGYGFQRGVFTVLGLLILVLWPLLFCLPVSGSVVTAVSDQYEKVPWGRVITLFVAMTFLYGSLGGIFSFSERIGMGIGLERGTIGLYLGFSPIAGIGGGLLAGILGTRFGRTGPAAVGFIVAGGVCMTLAQAEIEAVYAFALVGYGFIFTFTIAYLLGTAAALDRQGRIAVAASGYLLLAFSLGSWLFGLHAEQQQSYAALGWPGFVACCFGLLIVFPVLSAVDKDGVITQAT